MAVDPAQGATAESLIPWGGGGHSRKSYPGGSDLGIVRVCFHAVSVLEPSVSKELNIYSKVISKANQNPSCAKKPHLKLYPLSIPLYYKPAFGYESGGGGVFFWEKKPLAKNLISCQCPFNLEKYHKPTSFVQRGVSLYQAQFDNNEKATSRAKLSTNLDKNIQYTLPHVSAI